MNSTCKNIKQIRKYANNKRKDINNKTYKTQTNQTKTKLSLQGPQWSRHSVARVRRRGKYSTLSKMCMVSIWQIWGDKKILSFVGGKWNGSRHLVFWSLGTLTSLRDRARGLVA
jgi:acetyl-CoA carboxylase alpha subunit